MRSNEKTRAGELRWVRLDYPDGTTKMILQQVWVTTWTEYGETRNTEHIERDWRDVPIAFHPYESPR